jgi:hypothetical protein
MGIQHQFYLNLNAYIIHQMATINNPWQHAASLQSRQKVNAWILWPGSSYHGKVYPPQPQHEVDV